MNSPSEHPSSTATVERLEQGVEALLQLVEQLRADNQRLQALQAATEAERQRLEGLRQQTRERLTVLLDKLKALEVES